LTGCNNYLGFLETLVHNSLPDPSTGVRPRGYGRKEESGSELYRLGDDEFAVLLKLETRDAHMELVDRILKRMELQAREFGLPDAVADTVLIFFDQTPTSLDLILLLMDDATRIIKSPRDCYFMSFESADFQIQAQILARWKSSHCPDISLSVRWLSFNGIQQVLERGKSWMRPDTKPTRPRSQACQT
jgi:hypothetical protein